jgi:phosphoglycerate dehydrogenase-like enzyme
MSDSKTIWCNATFPADARELLATDIAPYRLVTSGQLSQSNLHSGGADLLLAEAAIAFGQPDPQHVIDLPKVKWVHLNSAGYTRYDTAEFRAAMNSRQGILTNSSSVYSEPCAEHAMAMMMALARQLPQAMDDQRGDRRWPSASLRANSRLLRGQSILIYGYGTIAKRLVELLLPFGMRMTGVRRQARGDEGIPMVSIEQADALLPQMDHVMNILPASPHTEHFFDARRLSRLSPHAYFYNIGRGNTADQSALQAVLQQRKIAGAYLDVTTPEPLPADHPLWKLPNCLITPHTAGGHHDEMVRLVKHFRENLDRYQRGQALLDRVV